MENDYKWVIIKKDGKYTLTGHALVNGKWDGPDGQPLVWSYLDAPLEHIRKQETDVTETISQQLNRTQME